LIYINTGNKRQFKSISTFLSYGNHTLIAIDDFDNNGRQNNIITCRSSGSMEVLKLSDNSNEVILDSKTYILYGQSSSMTTGRFNDDELQDLAVVDDSQSDTLQILLAYRDGTFTQQIYSTANYSTSASRINFNNDQFDDIVVLSCNQTIIIFLGTLIGLFDRYYLLFDFSEQKDNQCLHSMKVADLNQDGKDDLVFIDGETHSIGVLLDINCYE